MSRTDAFLDTNVLVHALSTDRSKARRSDDLMDIGGVISVQVLNEFTVVARRKYRLDWSFVRARLSEIREAFTVVPLTLDTHVRGIELSERYQLGVYDAMIVAAALGAGCETLWSEDMRDGLAIDGLTIRNPYNALR